MLSITKQRVSIAATAAALALGAGALYASAQDQPEPNGGGSAPSADALVSSYAAYARSDQRPTGRVRAMIDVINREFDVNPNQARGVTTVDGKQAWIIPANDGLCFGADDGEGTGYSCATVAELVDDPTVMSAADSDGSVRAVFLVPDATVALEVAGRRFDASNNTVVAHYERGATVTRVDRDGTRVAMPDR